MKQKVTKKEIQEILLHYADRYNQLSFIEQDPISIPHQFHRKQDIEIIGFWAAMLSWGNRKTIINKGNELITLFEQNPYDFVRFHSELDLRRFERFIHRTFNSTDALYFISFFSHWYSEHDSLEEAFYQQEFSSHDTVESHLEHFHQVFFSLPDLSIRTKKHVSKPSTKSRCKRLAMFLRWMVRSDDKKVDFGLWKKIQTSQLILPLDVHVERTARNLKLLERKALDWQAVMELSSNCKKIVPNDPCLLDYALFGMSIDQKFLIL